MPYSWFINNELNQISTLVSSANNNSSLYFFKDNNGNVQVFNSENQQNFNNTGYAYQFLNGSVSYTTFPISNITQIPYDFNYNGLGSLFNDKLILWYDAKEPKCINTNSQRILSKGHSSNEIAVENTAERIFTYYNDTIDLSNTTMLETSSTIAQRQFWTLCLVVTLTTQNLTNHTIFQHNDISIRISGPRLAPNFENNAFMISLHTNGTFRQGITFKPNDINLRYIIYCNQSGNFTVNSNISSMFFTGNFTHGNNHKVFIGQQSDTNNNALIRLHELFYYTSTSDNIGLNYSSFTTYLNSKWSLTTYFDSFNVLLQAMTPTLSTATQKAVLNQNFTFNYDTQAITITADNQDNNYCIIMPRYITSTETRTIFICIEFLNTPSDVSTIGYGFLRSTNGTTAINANGTGYGEGSDGLVLFQNYSMYGTHVSRFFMNYYALITDSNPNYTGFISYTTNWKMTLSIDFTNKSVIFRGFNASNTQLFSVSRSVSSQLTSGYLNGFRLYPYISVRGNVGAQLRFNRTFTINGEVNVMTLT